MMKEKDYADIIVKEKPYCYSMTTDNPHDDKCKHGVPWNWQDKNFMQDPEKKNKGKSEVGAKWETFRHYLSNGALSAKDFQNILHTQLDNVPKLFFFSPLGTFSVINGRMKGNRQYASKMAAKAIGLSQKIMRKKRYLYFLTVTYSPKDDGDDRLQAWANYGKKLSVLNRFLREKYGALYIRALESTGKQYPHAHYFLGTNKEIDFCGNELLNQNIGKETSFWQEIQSVLPAPVFCLEKAEGVGSAFYVAKYISKSQNTDLRNLKIPHDKKKRKKFLKEMATICIPIICNLRQIDYSRSIDKTADLPKEEYMKLQREKSVEFTEKNSVVQRYDLAAWVDWYMGKFEFDGKEMARVQAGFMALHDGLDNGTLSRAERAKLDMLLTNSTKNCTCARYMGFGKKCVEKFGDDDIKDERWNDELLDWAENNLYRIGCAGCPLARFSAILQGIDGVNPLPSEWDLMTLEQKKLEQANDTENILTSAW